MRPDPDAGFGKAFPPLFKANGPQAAEVVHIRGYQVPVAQEACFQAHLGKGHIVVHALNLRFLGIKPGQFRAKIIPRAVVHGEEEAGQDLRCHLSRSQNVEGDFRDGLFRTFRRGRELRENGGFGNFRPFRGRGGLRRRLKRRRGNWPFRFNGPPVAHTGGEEGQGPDQGAGKQGPYGRWCRCHIFQLSAIFFVKTKAPCTAAPLYIQGDFYERDHLSGLYRT
jgi:hypothetical protein